MKYMYTTTYDCIGFNHSDTGEYDSIGPIYKSTIFGLTPKPPEEDGNWRLISTTFGRLGDDGDFLFWTWEKESD